MDVFEDRRGGTVHGLTVTSSCHDTRPGRSLDRIKFDPTDWSANRVILFAENSFVSPPPVSACRGSR